MPQVGWIILFPTLVFVVILLSGRRLGEKAGWLAPAGTGLSFLFALSLLFKVYTFGPQETVFLWARIGSVPLEFKFLVDGLSASMLAMVSLVSLMVQIYSNGYMHGEERFTWFYAAISLFTASMLGLVSSGNLLMLLIFWEIMGLCSYLLIGFWFEKEEARKAAVKAFITTRIGDVGFLAAVALIFGRFGTLNIPEVFELAHKASPVFVTGVTLLLFWGAMGKSAQFPLHVWLPDAMAGPTPVSALLHSATMVAAGVFLVARTYPLFEMSSHTMAVVAVVGMVTALFAASMALYEHDIKRILAYSTVSQLGYMMGSLGAGAFVAAVFHLLTHAFFKSLLFLGAGSVIHATHTQDITQMGGLRKVMPHTSATFLIAALALSGIPPLAGFWSKDEIIGGLFHANLLLAAVGILVALMTAFYMFRLFFRVFAGEAQVREERDEHPAAAHATVDHGAPHESPAVMTVPLRILAAITVIGGLMNLPWWPYLAGFIVMGEEAHEAPLYALMVLSAVVASTGIFLAWLAYGRPSIAAQCPPAIKGFGAHARRRYYFDDFYQAVVVVPVFAASEALRLFDVYVVDGIVNLVGWLAVAFTAISGGFDLGVVDGVVNGVAGTAKAASARLRTLQTGLVSNYVLLMVVIGIALAYLAQGGW